MYQISEKLTHFWPCYSTESQKIRFAFIILYFFTIMTTLQNFWIKILNVEFLTRSRQNTHAMLNISYFFKDIHLFIKRMRPFHIQFNVHLFIYTSINIINECLVCPLQHIFKTIQPNLTIRSSQGIDGRLYSWIQIMYNILGIIFGVNVKHLQY